MTVPIVQWCLVEAMLTTVRNCLFSDIGIQNVAITLFNTKIWTDIHFMYKHILLSIIHLISIIPRLIIANTITIIMFLLVCQFAKWYFPLHSSNYLNISHTCFIRQFERRIMDINIQTYRYHGLTDNVSLHFVQENVAHLIPCIGTPAQLTPLLTRWYSDQMKYNETCL